jgi:uncharacterized protein (TIGR02246 family)
MASAAQEVNALYESLIAAWNDRDAAGMARLYAPAGNQVGFDGSAMDSPAAIERGLDPIFRDHPTARFVTIVREIRELGPETMMLRAVAGMIPPGETAIKPDRNAVQTLVASRSGDGRWQIELFQNTPARYDGRPELAAALTRELQSVADRRSAA